MTDVFRGGRASEDVKTVRLYDDVKDLERKVRSTDPESSWQAAARVKSTESAELTEQIYDLLQINGPQTDDALYELYTSAGGRLTPQRVRTARASMARPAIDQPAQVHSLGRTGTSARGGSAQLWEAIP